MSSSLDESESYYTPSSLLTLTGIPDYHSSAVPMRYRNVNQFTTATETGDMEKLKDMIVAAPDVINKENSDGVFAIHVATVEGHYEMVEFLLDMGADIEARTKHQRTPLQLSLVKGRLTLTRLLLEKGANFNALSKYGWFPLHYASLNGVPEGIELLLQKGADIEARDMDGLTPLHVAVTTLRPKAVEYLLQRGANVSSLDYAGKTPLHWACTKGRVDIVEILLAYKADIHIKDADGRDAFSCAAGEGHVGVLRRLLLEGPPVNMQDKYGLKGLHPKPRLVESEHPYRNNTTDYIPIEIRAAHSYVVAFDEQSSTELNCDFITFAKDMSLSEVFGEARYSGGQGGTPKNFPGVGGIPPLTVDAQRFMAYFFSDGRSIDWGYKIYVTPVFLRQDSTQDGWTPLMWASYGGHKECVQFLLESGAQMDVIGWSGDTSLSMAIRRRQVEVAITLITAGARVEIRNKEGVSPLEYAIQLNMRTVISTIILTFRPFPDDRVCLGDRCTFVWLHILAHTTAFEEDVCAFLDKNIDKLAILSDTIDQAGRRAFDVATPAYKRAIMERLYFFKRYDFREGCPEHQSNSCIVRIAKDFGDNGTLVAMKFMADKTQYLREISVRSRGQLSSTYVINMLRSHDGDVDTAFATEAGKKGYFKYCIVMPAAERNLATVLTHEHLGGREWDQLRSITTDLVKALSHLHKQGYIHADFKPLNVMRLSGRYKLIDLDASVRIGAGSYVGAKYSSAYIPPEMTTLDVADDEVVVRSFIQDEVKGVAITEKLIYTLVEAEVNYDMWALGVTLYHMFSGEPLFRSNDEDNIDQEQLHKLHYWTDSYKNECLSKVKSSTARNLLSRLLSKDRKFRPDTARVLAHPFLSGKKAARMVGESPQFDVFISYRVATESYLAEALYEELNRMGLRVWLDRKCLASGELWETGFCDGLVNSAVFVPLLSRDAIENDRIPFQNFRQLREDSSCDNVLLEYRLALELKEMGLVEAIFPIMVGDTVDAGPVQDREYGSYRVHNQFPDEAVKTVETKLVEHLDRQGLGAPLVESSTVRSIVTGITSHQGMFISGPGKLVLPKISRMLKDTVREKTRRRSINTLDVDYDSNDVISLQKEIEHLHRKLLHVEIEKITLMNEVAFMKDPPPGP